MTATAGRLVPAWPGTLVVAGGFTLHVRHAPATSPDADRAVFVHGLGGGSASFTDLMAALRDRLDCLAPDLPGFGQSPPPADGDYGLDGQVRAVRALIERQPGRVHLIGNSVGGSVATRLAAESPQLVRTLTLIAPALPDLRPRTGPALLLVPLVPMVGAAAIRRAGRIPPHEQARRTLEGLFGDAARIRQERLDETAEEIRIAAGMQHMRNAYLGALRAVVAEYLRRGPRNLWRQAAAVTAPTLIFYGGRDPMIDARLAGRAARTFRHSTVVVLSDVGHVAQLEAPDAVLTGIRVLLKRSR